MFNLTLNDNKKHTLICIMFFLTVRRFFIICSISFDSFMKIGGGTSWIKTVTNDLRWLTADGPYVSHNRSNQACKLFQEDQAHFVCRKTILGLVYIFRWLHFLRCHKAWQITAQCQETLGQPKSLMSSIVEQYESRSVTFPLWDHWKQHHLFWMQGYIP